MLLLTSTSDVLRVVTGSAASVTCSVSAVDNTSGVISIPNITIPAAITTATTTTIVAAPSSGVQRNVKSVMIANTHSTVTTSVTVQRYDGTNSADLMGASLTPGERLVLDETGAWTHHDANGAPYDFTPQVTAPYAPSGVKAESIPRTIAGVNVSQGASGGLIMQAIWLPAGMVINNLITMSGTTGTGSQTNRWMALYDVSRNLLRQSADQTTTDLAASTQYTASITTYTTTYSGLYYIGIMTAASTVNTLVGVTGAGNLALRGLAPILTGISNTGLTTTAPNPAAAISATVNSYWMAVS